MPAPWPLRFGVFFAPFHALGQNPTLALQYDLERVEALDRYGYDEAWFGEHHSGGYELIGSPEMFIAGGADPVLMMTPLDAMTDWVPDLRGSVIVDGAGHWVQQERPDEVNTALLTFLDTITDRQET